MSIFSSLHVYQDISSRSAAINMAIDEALLEAATIPSIRFYRWKSPALSFGYFGKFADVAGNAFERDLVRRWTGGGIVFHGEDLTYSIVIPAADPAFAKSSMSIYEKIHRALAEALIASGRPAKLAVAAAVSDRRHLGKGDLPLPAVALRRRQIALGVENCRSLEPAVTASGYSCFAYPVHADVVINGRKIAGAAQRRTRAGLLQQGSIQGVDLGNGLADRFALSLSANCGERKIGDEVLNRALELARQKYGSDVWLRKR
jgi:lipoate-protein ligase A